MRDALGPPGYAGIRPQESAIEKVNGIALKMKEAGIYNENIGLVLDARAGGFNIDSAKDTFGKLPKDSPIKVFVIVDSDDEKTFDSIQKFGAIPISVVKDEAADRLLNKIERALKDNGVASNANASIAIPELQSELAIAHYETTQSPNNMFNFAIAGEDILQSKTQSLHELALLDLLARLASQNQPSVMAIGCRDSLFETLSSLQERIQTVLKLIRIKAEDIEEKITTFISALGSLTKSL